jgi:two-component system response regulator PhcR
MDDMNSRLTTILYVDDERMACKYFASAVGTDYEVLTALSADAAIAILADPNSRVGVLVTDYRMPGRDGGDLLRQIEREYPHIVRILVTAYVDKSVLLETVNSGEIFQILEKPLGLMEIRRVLRLASAVARERSAKRQKLLAIDETLVFLAHELNAPLAAIMDLAQSIGGSTHGQGANGQVRPEIFEVASSIRNNASYCYSMLSTFVSSSRNASATSGSGGEKDGSSACQIIASLLDTYPLGSTERNWIKTDIRKDFYITLFPNCVSIVLSSLLGNALRALRGCAAPLLCFTVLVDGHPQIRVSDNASEIPHEIWGRLLLDPITTHMPNDESGWSIIFCQRIMQSFGGNIVIEPDSDKGVTVILNFRNIKVS